MKVLTVLGLVQTGLLLILVGNLVLFDDPVPHTTATQESFATPAKTFNTNSDFRTSSAVLDEAALRQIIREELAARNGYGSASPEPAATPPPVNDIDVQYQRDYIAQQIEYFASVGRISPADMDVLLAEIAKLDPAGRQEMLSELTRALNSGRLEGRL